MPANGDSSNDNDENLTDIRIEFEALKTFLWRSDSLRNNIKKLNIEEVNSGKERHMISFRIIHKQK